MKRFGVVREHSEASDETTSNEVVDLREDLDASIDTLASMLRVTGDYAFDLEEPAEAFRKRCARFARHVATGAPVDDIDDQTQARDWRGVRHFYATRRKQEQAFVQERAGSYRALVEELSAGLRAVAAQESATERRVRDSLGEIEQVAQRDDAAAIRAAISNAVNAVADAFSDQRVHFETQLEQVNDRMASLRRDLELARESLKRDALTETYNRGAFDTALQQAIAINFVMRQSCLVVMLDLDHFKSINDTYGHVVGDEVLKVVADCLSRAFVRKSDVVARYGGEEFALILADIDLETAEKRVNELLKRISDAVELPETDEGPGPVVTCSAGMTQLTDADSPESVVARADAALYQAKRDGRNRLVIAPEPAPADSPPP